jgi:hypothetical protein
MATFTLTVTLQAADLRQASRVTEALRQAADQLVNNSNAGNIVTPFTKVDNLGVTQYAWSVA